MRESMIERYLVAQVEAIGGRAQKFVSPGHSHVPDRIVLMPGARIFFVECKAPGEHPTAGQLREHRRLRDMGFYVYVIDTLELVDAFIRMIAPWPRSSIK
jgi:hypothetical protein